MRYFFPRSALVYCLDSWFFNLRNRRNLWMIISRKTQQGEFT